MLLTTIVLGPEDEDDIRPAYAAAQGQNSSIARKEPVVRVAKKHPADRKTAAGIKKQKKRKPKRSHAEPAAIYQRKDSDMQMQDRGLRSFAIPRNLYKVGVREEVTRMASVTGGMFVLALLVAPRQYSAATDADTTMAGDNNERSITDVEDVIRQLDRLRT
jgi:hypothetical protein